MCQATSLSGCEGQGEEHRCVVNLGSIAQALLVAEHLSFRRAAQVLGVRQSAVSRRVRALEDMLGVSLLNEIRRVYG